jgi:hypothetical protein
MPCRNPSSRTLSIWFTAPNIASCGFPNMPVSVFSPIRLVYSSGGIGDRHEPIRACPPRRVTHTHSSHTAARGQTRFSCFAWLIGVRVPSRIWSRQCSTSFRSFTDCCMVASARPSKLRTLSGCPGQRAPPIREALQPSGVAPAKPLCLSFAVCLLCVCAKPSLEPILKQVSRSPVMRIEPIGATGDQVLHSPGEIGPGSAEEQMDWACRRSGESQRRMCRRSPRAHQGPQAVSIVAKYRLPPIATGHGMVDGAWKLYA